MTTNVFLEELSGVCHVGRLEKTLADHARALRVLMQEESEKPFPNTHLIAVLRDAACLGYEHLEAMRVRELRA